MPFKSVTPIDELEKAVSALRLEVAGEIVDDLAVKIRAALDWKEWKGQFDQVPEVEERDDVLIGEWQLCPKCNGQGIVYGQPFGTASTAGCDVCNGMKIIQKPLISNEFGPVQLETKSNLERQNEGLRKDLDMALEREKNLIREIEDLKGAINFYIEKENRW